MLVGTSTGGNNRHPACELLAASQIAGATSPASSDLLRASPWRSAGRRSTPASTAYCPKRQDGDAPERRSRRGSTNRGRHTRNRRFGRARSRRSGWPLVPPADRRADPDGTLCRFRSVLPGGVHRSESEVDVRARGPPCTISDRRIRSWGRWFLPGAKRWWKLSGPVPRVDGPEGPSSAWDPTDATAVGCATTSAMAACWQLEWLGD